MFGQVLIFEQIRSRAFGVWGLNLGVCTLPQIFSAPIGETMHRSRTYFGGARKVQTSITMPSLVELAYRAPPGEEKFNVFRLFFVCHAFV